MSFFPILALAIAAHPTEEPPSAIITAIDNCMAVVATGQIDPDPFVAAAWTQTEVDPAEVTSARALVRLDAPASDDWVIISEYPGNLECNIFSTTLGDDEIRSQLIKHLGERTFRIDPTTTGFWTHIPKVLVVLPDLEDDAVPHVVATYLLDQED